ncbi:enoyl-CoA hydratase/isomerase family protein [Parasphingorhabdus sp. DH2-15]|uniref:enoyl-CoA hydratase/isomerase family protein n=1 Tax=Parasphingorhabdus sp. DH2-15 TaxID=3444112 RepID=UPI003F688C11
MSDKVLVAQQDHVLTLTLNRPDALNAFQPEMLEILRDVIASADENVRVAVIEGAGRAFSAGVDLKVLQGTAPVAGKIGTIFDAPSAELGAAIRAAPFPVIAKVHGFCFTGALEIALYCDMIFTTKATKFGDTHAKFGIRPTWGMTQNLPRAIGIRRARELSFTARTFLGAEAVDMGLANMAVEDKDALDALIAERCGQIVSNSTTAIAAIKDLYRVAEANHDIEDAIAEEAARSYPDIDDTEKRLAGF